MDLGTTVSLLLLLLLLGLCNAHNVNDHDADDEISGDGFEEEDVTTTILRTNNGSRDFLLEGDVFIPRTRNAIRCLKKPYSCLWPKSADGNVDIHFLISDRYDETERNEILGAMTDMESKTCIRFIPRVTESAYLSIEPRFGCYSLLGSTGDRQLLSLQRFGCVRRGVIQHELLHALGFQHEHNRSDRDNYVKIHWDNLYKFAFLDFQKRDTDNLNTAYDYSSVMHYGRTAYGKYGAETMTPIPDPSVPIGQRDGMSDTDVIRINRLYRCCSYSS